MAGLGFICEQFQPFERRLYHPFMAWEVVGIAP